MQSLLHDGLLRESNVKSEMLNWRETSIGDFGVATRRSFWGEDHMVGVLYGLVNLIVCVPSLVSYAHIVFVQSEFQSSMPYLVKLYFLSSAVMQITFTMKSTIVFSIGQVQDVGLIFLAAMVKNIVFWARAEEVAIAEIVATSLWQCASSTFFVGLCLIFIGRLKLSQYVQMLPLPVVGGYLGYIGYFCLAAGLSIGSGKELGGPLSLLALIDPELKVKLTLLAGMTLIMLVVHFRVRHFLAMPAVLLLLPVVFLACASALGYTMSECQDAGWLPPQQATHAAPGIGAVDLFDPTLVKWSVLPRQLASVIGLLIIVAFGSSLDIAAIQAEMEGQKIDYNKELTTIGLGNLLSGLTGGATGSYIFSQTIFSAKRGVQSRWNGFVVFLGEFLLFLIPVDILRFLPNSYIGGVMCLFGIDIMNDWLVNSRHLMSRTEYVLVWVSFAATMWLTSSETFGVIEGMALGTIAASFIFAIQYARAHKTWHVVPARSSVIRPPLERRTLAQAAKTVFAVSLDSFMFFGGSLQMAQEVEEQAAQRGARFVCIDFGRLSGMDSTAADQIRLLVLSLERMDIEVLLSSLRSKTVQRLLEAHGVIDSAKGRPVFGTLDQALQNCEEQILATQMSPSRARSTQEVSLAVLLLEYIDAKEVARAEAAANSLVPFFQRLEFPPGAALFHQDDPANEIFVVAAGSVRVSSTREWVMQLSMNVASPPLSRVVSPVSTPFAGAVLSPQSAYLPPQIALDGISTNVDDETAERVGVGGILGDTAFYARKKHGCDAVADAIDGCVVFRITRSTIDRLEDVAPSALVFLQKVILRDLTQLQVQHLGPMSTTGLS